MATLLGVQLPARAFRFLPAPQYWKVSIIFLLLASAFFCAPPGFAQFQQPFVFAGGGVVFSRNDQTGLLTPVPGSPFATVHDPSVIDVQGRFLFGLGQNSIRMFTVDAAKGSYAEVPNSPFASPNTNFPTFLAVEKSGQYLAVVNAVGQKPGEASVETFKIDPVNLALVPVPGSFVEMESTPVGKAGDPANSRFFLYLGPNPSSSSSFYREDAALLTITIDSQTGMLSGAAPTTGSTQHGRCFAADPQLRYVVTGFGSNFGFIQSFGIDGKFTGSSLQLPGGLFPQELFIDSTGTFLYVTTTVSSQSVVHIYSVNLQTGAMAETPSSPLPGFSSVANIIADPTGPFVYLETSPIHGFAVASSTGYFTEIAGSPFSPAGDAALLFSVPPGGQPISGPVATLSASALSFGSITVGNTSGPQTLTVTSGGGQALSLNTISISGADPSDFSKTDTCQTPTVLQPGKFCSITVTFAPAATGPRQATLSLTDNAPDSPQLIQLTGSGVAPPPPAPAVTLVPSAVSFPTTTVGTTAGPLAVTLTNSGTASLNISAVTLGGNNSGDFSIATNTCAGAIAAKANCTFAVTFTPLAASTRTAAISITDDATDSPQSVQLTGTGSTPPPTAPAVTLTPPILSFGTVTEGTTNGPQTLTITNSGAGTLHISSVVLGGTNAADFTMTTACSGAALAVNAACTVSLTFSPVSASQHTATITLTDDAPGSPQVINVGGNVNPAFVILPAQNGSTSAMVTAGHSAQYNLQVVPGAGYTGTISFACTGAPLGASCQIPATMQISSGNPVPLTVTVTTSGGSAFLPHSNPPQLPPFAPGYTTPLLLLAAILFFVYSSRGKRDSILRNRRLAHCCAAAVIVSFAVLSAAGCGGGSMASAPPAAPAIVTPQGTSTLTITPTAMSVSGKPLQLQQIQLTLTVQ